MQPQEKKVFELPKPSTESSNYRLYLQFMSTLLIDLEGHELKQEEVELLEHPLVAGLIYLPAIL